MPFPTSRSLCKEWAWTSISTIQQKILAYQLEKQIWRHKNLDNNNLLEGQRHAVKVLDEIHARLWIAWDIHRYYASTKLPTNGESLQSVITIGGLREFSFFKHICSPNSFLLTITFTLLPQLTTSLASHNQRTQKQIPRSWCTTRTRSRKLLSSTYLLLLRSPDDHAVRQNASESSFWGRIPASSSW